MKLTATHTLGCRILHHIMVFCTTGWHDTCREKMMSFGLILTMGIVQLSDNHMKDYWSRHETLNLSFVQIVPKNKKREILSYQHSFCWSVMSRDRFCCSSRNCTCAIHLSSRMKVSATSYLLTASTHTSPWSGVVWPSLEQSRLTDVGCRRQLSVWGSRRWQEDVSGRIGLGRPWCCNSRTNAMSQFCPPQKHATWSRYTHAGGSQRKRRRWSSFNYYYKNMLGVDKMDQLAT